MDSVRPDGYMHSFLVCFIIFSVLLSFVFLIYNFIFFFEKNEKCLYAIILLGKD